MTLTQEIQIDRLELIAKLAVSEFLTASEKTIIICWMHEILRELNRKSKNN